ncbi:MAG: hypothetical protein RLZZ326_677 [Planctomycetota bacterium]|jgi:hypothetical protein
MSGDGRHENELYSDDLVRITSTRVVIGGVTYALRTITSVRAYKETRYAPLAAAGLLALLILFNSVTNSDFQGFVLGLGFLGMGYAAHQLDSTKWHVGIRTSSGEVSALQLRDPQRIYLIADKISDALANY